MGLETLAVSKLMERMVNNGASLEELKKVADYMVTAAVYDEMTVNLYDVAEKNGIKELAKSTRLVFHGLAPAIHLQKNCST